MSGSFFDTNVLVYTAYPDDLRSARANDLIRVGGCVSVQNLNEFANVTRKKLKRTWVEIGMSLTALRAALTVHPVTLETHRKGLALAERYDLSTYGAMIVAAALLAGCDTLWSEDMQHEMRVDGVLTIRNPFRP